MEHRFETHGLNFVVESDGFASNARQDFETICEKIEQALEAMPPAELTDLHTAAIADFGGPATIGLAEIGDRIKGEVTRGWHNPNACGVSLIPVP